VQSDAARSTQTLYSLLQLHPAAPLDLVSAAYWRLAAQAQAARGADHTAEQRLNELTNAYRVLADASTRRQYDTSLGLPSQPISPLAVRPRASWLARLLRSRPRQQRPDHYELLRVDVSASAGIVDEAYPIVRGHYLRLVRVGEEPEELLYLLEQAYAVISDPVRRMTYNLEIGYAPAQPPPVVQAEMPGRMAADG
jgi:curved DNA-binding protein CbpA